MKEDLKRAINNLFDNNSRIHLEEKIAMIAFVNSRQNMGPRSGSKL